MWLMKITSLNTKYDFTIREAVENAATPNAYSYDGELEKMKGENEKLRELVARLVETLYGEEQYNKPEDKLAHILGYGFEVER